MIKPKWLRSGTQRCWEIVWEDHSQPVSDDIDPATGPLHYQTTGYIREENEQAIILCRDFGDQKDFCGCITILKKNIILRRQAR